MGGLPHLAASLAAVSGDLGTGSPVTVRSASLGGGCPVKRPRIDMLKLARATEEIGRTLLVTALAYFLVLGVLLLFVLMGSC